MPSATVDSASPAQNAIVVIPTYREIDNLPELLDLIWKNAPDLNVLIVDDASGDGAPAYLQARPEFGAKLFLLERQDKDGLARAYLAGFKWVLGRPYDYVLQMDADLSHDPVDLPRLLAETDKGYDLVLASRYFQGVRVLNWEISRLLLSLGASFYVRLITRMPFMDPTGGFKCYRAAMLRLVHGKKIRSQGYSFQIETLFWAYILGGNVTELPIIFGQRKNGASKMSGGIAVEASWQVIRIALLNAAYRLRSLLGASPRSPVSRVKARGGKLPV